MLLLHFLYMFYTFCTTLWKHVCAALFFVRKTLFFTLFCTVFAQCVQHTFWGWLSHTGKCCTITASENMIFNIFHEKLAQKSSVFIKVMQLFTTCVFNTCLKSGVYRKYHITIGWSEILIFAIFRKKLAQKSSVFVK
jgi:hypothetical protein